MNTFKDFYNRQRQKFFSYLFRHAGDYHLACDILQESFTRLFEKYTAEHFTPQLLYTIGRNLVQLPNPTSDPGGVERAIWLVPVSGGPPRKLADGAGLALAPDGREVAYLSGGVVMTVGLDSGSTPKAIIRARGGQGSLRWSPDGSKLAFVSNRGLHAFVGIYDFASKAIRWMDPGVDQDVEPVWSPDGRTTCLRPDASRFHAQALRGRTGRGVVVHPSG